MDDDELESLLAGMPLREPSASLDARVRLSVPLWRRRIPVWQAAAASLLLAGMAYFAGGRPREEPLPIWGYSGSPVSQATAWVVSREQHRIFDLTKPEPVFDYPVLVEGGGQ